LAYKYILFFARIARAAEPKNHQRRHSRVPNCADARRARTHIFPFNAFSFKEQHRVAWQSSEIYQ